MGKEKKNIRVWNVDHYCLYSSYSGNNLSRHLRNKHSDEKEMKELLEMDESPSLSAKRMELLRMRGDHAHNRSVLSCGSGTIVLSRHPTEDFDIDYYGPCPACLSWMRSSEIQRHQKTGRSLALKLRKTSDEINHQSSALNTRKKSDTLKGNEITTLFTASDLLQNEVLIPMHAGEIKEVVIKDCLIIHVRLGETWLSKASRNKLRRGNYTSERIRRMGKLLLECRRNEDMVSPDHVETIIDASLRLSGCSGQFSMQTPSVAKRLKEDIMKIANAKEFFAIIEHDTEKEQDVKRFFKIFESQWAVRVERTATAVATNKQFNRKQELPEPEDVEKLTKYVKKPTSPTKG